jgi:hypothetical protein
VRVRHLAGRFTRALYPGPPRADDLAWVASILTPDADALFRRQPRHDQRHAIAVARGVQVRLEGTPHADDPRWLAAALLHDIGKLDARLGIPGRVVATVSASVGGRDMAEAWSSSSGFTRRVGLYLRHAELGPDRIRLAGGLEGAARRPPPPHDPSTWSDLGFPARVVAALDESDND